MTIEQQESSADDSRARTVIGLFVLINRRHGLQSRTGDILRHATELSEEKKEEEIAKLVIAACTDLARRAPRRFSKQAAG